MGDWFEGNSEGADVRTAWHGSADGSPVGHAANLMLDERVKLRHSRGIGLPQHPRDPEGGVPRNAGAARRLHVAERKTRARGGHRRGAGGPLPRQGPGGPQEHEAPRRHRDTVAPSASLYAHTCPGNNKDGEPWLIRMGSLHQRRFDPRPSIQIHCCPVSPEEDRIHERFCRPPYFRIVRRGSVHGTLGIVPIPVHHQRAQPDDLPGKQGSIRVFQRRNVSTAVPEPLLFL